ncbi:MAG: hypothetical protein AAF560_10160 [Acidobacteriota bacterium]
MTDQAAELPELTLEAFVEQATRSVLAAQQRLDRAGPLARPIAPGQELVYALPRAAFTIDSAIIMDKKRVRFTRRRRQSTLSHRLGFSLVAVPEPPIPPTGSPVLELVEPAFLLSRREEEQLLSLLVDSLRDPDGWWIIDEATTRDLRSKHSRLTRRIRRLANRLEHELMVFFRLTRGRFLVVRVQGMGKRGEKGKRDSLFVVTPDKDPKVTIYTFPKDPFSDTVSYRPFHDLAVIVRRWLRNELIEHRSPWRPSDSLGFEALDGFVQSLSRAYDSNLRLLASQEDEALLPSYFDLNDVEAQLSFSVETSNGQISFRERFQAEEIDAGVAAHVGAGAATSRVTLHAERRQGRPALAVHLDRIEFLPRGATRQALLDQVLAFKDQIAQRIDPAHEQRYLDLLTNAELQRGAVVFRSLQVRKVGEELIVIWPGRLGDRPRDFVFSYERVGDRIDHITKIMALEEDLDNITIDLKSFGAFHRFFAAVRLWRDRGAA